MTSNEDIKTVTSKYLTESDFEAIQEVINGKQWGRGTRSATALHYVLSFREAGVPTIYRLNQGCGAKPHDVLEKSIKLPDGKAANNNNHVSEYLNANSIGSNLSNPVGTYNLIRGFVGYREPTGLKGLFLTDLGSKVFKKRPAADLHGCSVSRPPGTKRDVLIIGDWKTKSLNSVITGYECCFFTGDYDLMDCIKGNNYFIEPGFDEQIINRYAGKGSSILGNEYVTMFIKMNVKILESDNHASNAIKNLCGNKDVPFDKDLFWKDYKRIQHGPQFGYLAYMFNNEIRELGAGKKLELKKVVSDFGFPLLFVHPIRTADTHGLPVGESVTFVSLNPADPDIWKTAWNKYSQIIKSYGLEPKHRWADPDQDSRTKYVQDLIDTFNRDNIKILFT